MAACAHGWTGVRPGTRLGTAEKVPVVVGKVPVVGDGIEDREVVGGIVGIDPTVPRMGDTLIVGTEVAGLTPRLPISVDPSGIPAREIPPDAVGDVDVGVDDAAKLLEPEPHIPDRPEVSIIAELVGIPDPADAPGDAAVAPADAPVAGVADPVAIPPPS
jgi:hypothetical protein